LLNVKQRHIKMSSKVADPKLTDEQIAEFKVSLRFRCTYCPRKNKR